MIKEWNFTRTILCIMIVLLHSTTQIYKTLGAYPDNDIVHFVRTLLTLATPGFILLSEIILSHKYKNHIPSKYFEVRIKYILGPFITFAIVDAIVIYLNFDNINFVEGLLRNFQGNYAGYFILVIFQFYILHYLIVKFNLPVKKLMFVGFLIMIIYLLFINSNYIELVPISKWRWRIFALAWLGYFFTAYLIGYNYNNVSKFLKKYRWLTFVFLFYSIYLVYQSYYSGVKNVNSIRLDMFPLTLSFILLLLAWGQIIPNNRIINLISNYSLGIYLIHWQIQTILSPYIIKFFSSSSISILVLFVLTLLFSVLVIYLVSLLPFGSFFIGRTVRKYNES